MHYALEDGRNMLLTSGDARYDLITVGLTTIWFSGATNLYSQEFYQLAHAGHLTDDGVLQQWVQLHRIGPDEISSAIASARSAFPYVSYWSYDGAGMILAANHPLDLRATQRERLGVHASRARRIAVERSSGSDGSGSARPFAEAKQGWTGWFLSEGP